MSSQALIDLVESHENLRDAYQAWNPETKEEVVLVLTEGSLTSEEKESVQSKVQTSFPGWPRQLVFKDLSLADSEGTILNNDFEGDISDELSAQLMDIHMKSSQFMKYADVQGVMPFANREGKACLMMFVIHKTYRPKGYPTFPSLLDGHPVCLQENTFTQC